MLGREVGNVPRRIFVTYLKWAKRLSKGCAIASGMAKVVRM